MALKLITAASTFPITLEDAKLHCRVDTAADDALINALITAATELAEQKTGRALMAQTWELTLDAFPEAFELTRVPEVMRLIGSVGLTSREACAKAASIASRWTPAEAH